MPMFRFRFDRSVALESVEHLSSGDLRVNTFSHGSAVFPRSSIRVVRTRHLRGTNLDVVDFGRPLKDGCDPAEAIIATGAKYRLPR